MAIIFIFGFRKALYIFYLHAHDVWKPKKPPQLLVEIHSPILCKKNICKNRDFVSF